MVSVVLVVAEHWLGVWGLLLAGKAEVVQASCIVYECMYGILKQLGSILPLKQLRSISPCIFTMFACSDMSGLLLCFAMLARKRV